ncbi:MAG: DNA-binding protein [Oligoflexia bacterium]|nr:DNA-binding protein [Oligoflexia bacterium]
MGAHGITKEQVFDVAEKIQETGTAPTLQSIREALGAGSYSTISKYLSEWKETLASHSVEIPAPPAEYQSYMQKVWAATYKAANQILEGEKEALRAERAKIKEEKDALVGALERVEDDLDKERLAVARAQKQIADLQKEVADQEQIKQELLIIRNQYTIAEERRVETAARAERLEQQLTEFFREQLKK